MPSPATSAAAASLEQRTRDAEEGRASAELARRDVEQVLNQRLLGKVLPEVVVRLLRDAWSKVMLLICLKHGALRPSGGRPWIPWTS